MYGFGVHSVRMKSSGWLSSRQSVYSKESMGPGEHEPLRGPASTRRPRGETTDKEEVVGTCAKPEGGNVSGRSRPRCQMRPGERRVQQVAGGKVAGGLGRAVPGAPGGKAGLQRVKE